MAGIKETFRSDDGTQIHLQVPKVGFVKLSKQQFDFPRAVPSMGLPDRPWHVVTFGMNYATPAACIKFLEGVVAKWDDEPEDHSSSGTCHAEMTGSFLATEASLDSCPW